MIAPPSKIVTAELSPESAPPWPIPLVCSGPGGNSGTTRDGAAGVASAARSLQCAGAREHSRRSSETVEQRRGPNRAVSVMNMRRAAEQVGETAAPEQAKDHQCDRSAARPPGRGSRPPDRGQVCPGSSLLLRGADYRARSMTRSGAWLNRSVVTAE